MRKQITVDKEAFGYMCQLKCKMHFLVLIELLRNSDVTMTIETEDAGYPLCENLRISRDEFKEAVDDLVKNSLLLRDGHGRLMVSRMFLDTDTRGW